MHYSRFAYGGRIANISREIGGEIYVKELPVTSEKLLLTQTIGEIDHVVVNEQVARSVLADNYPEFDYSMQISFSQFQPWALRLSDTAKAAAVNSRLDSIKATEDTRVCFPAISDSRMCLFLWLVFFGEWLKR